MSHSSGPAGESPVITVRRGSPAPAELAAVLAVLLARSSAATEPGPHGAPASQWAERSRTLTAFPRPGPGSWRASALPLSSC
jgi:hypothetical protein